MAEQPKPDRTSVTISKDIHRELKIAAAKSGFSQRDIVEAAIKAYIDWMEVPGFEPDEEEE